MTRHTFAVEGTTCAACAIRIDDAVEAVPGVTRSQTSIRRRQTVVELDDAAAGSAQIVAVIAAIGYTATPVADS